MSRPGEDMRPRHARLIDRLGDKPFPCWDDEGFHPERIDEPPDLLLFFAALFFVSEVYNGGFHQFFTNYSGVLAHESVRGMRMLGMDEGADVLLRAMAFFGEPYPISQEDREKRLAGVPGDTRDEWDPFCELDHEFEDCVGDRIYDVADQFSERYP